MSASIYKKSKVISIDADTRENRLRWS